jgi:hypothetical protein
VALLLAAACGQTDAPGFAAEPGDDASAAAVDPAAGQAAGGPGAALTDAGLLGMGPDASSQSSSPPPSAIDQCGTANPAGLGAAQVSALVAGSGSAGAMKWLYPYDGTVFPRGMLAPLLMWDGGPADAVYVHIASKSFEYRGCLRPTATGQIQLGQDVWDAAGAHTGARSDPYALELTVLSQGAVTGPIRETLVIAPATVKGSIYYNSYSSKLGVTTASPDGGWGSGFGIGYGGKILRIPPKKPAEAFITTGCTGCHSVSASGSRLLTQTTYPGAASYVLTPTTAPNPPAQNAGGAGCFGALYPDGSIFLSTATPTAGLAHCNAGASTLRQTDTGALVPGANVPAAAWMPTFSPDGQLLTWTDGTNPKDLVVASFSRATNATSSPRTIYAESDATQHPGWPFVLPDDRAVVFERTTSSDYSGEGAGVAGGLGGPSGDLYIVDLKSGTSTLLARAMGFATPADAASGKSDLPFGTDEVHKNFFPTVSPVAAGGYFWVFFDSMRHYGSLGLQRQLWGTAVLVSADGTYNVDPSSPAFYVPGQEFGTGNHRAFTALDPCLADGASCSSGTDCCGGFCNAASGGAGMCGKPAAPRCSQIDEACKASSDCCAGVNASCIANYCATVNPPLQ